jgi:hypothetical protein
MTTIVAVACLIVCVGGLIGVAINHERRLRQIERGEAES